MAELTVILSQPPCAGITGGQAMPGQCCDFQPLVTFFEPYLFILDSVYVLLVGSIIKRAALWKPPECRDQH